MAALDENSCVEQVALDNERQAFWRRQNAYFALVRESAPQGTGQLTAELLDEYEQADSDWKVACSEFDRIGREILVGVLP